MPVILEEDTNFTNVYVTGDTGTGVHKLLEHLLTVRDEEGNDHKFYEPGYPYFLRGLTPYVSEQLHQRGVPVQWQAKPRALREPMPSEATFGRHLQPWVVDQMLPHKYGTLSLATRFGKSYIYAAWWLRAGRPMTVIFVPTEAIARQMREELAAVLKEPVGIIGASVQKIPDWQRLTVCIENSLFDQGGILRPEHLPYLAACEARIRDECHKIGNRMIAVYMAMPNCIYSWGGSATPLTDNPLHNWMMIGWHGPLRVQIPALLASQYGIIAPAQIAWIRYTHPKVLEQRSFDKMYVELIVSNHERNLLIGSIARELIERGKTGIIFVNHAAHTQFIASQIPKAMSVASSLVTPTEAEDIKRWFNAGEISCVVTTKKWREGVTFKCDFAINAEAMKADHVSIQKLGRGLIPKENGKPLLWIDIDDYGYHTFRNQARERAECYDSEGWPQQFFANINGFKQALWGGQL